MNYWAVLLAAVSSFMLGGLWYSPRVFGQAWNAENGGQPPAGHPARVFAASFVFSLIAAIAFAGLFGPEPSLPVAVQKGLLIGCGFVAACFGINYQFAQRTFKLWLIDSGYHVAQFILFALILGLWH